MAEHSGLASCICVSERGRGRKESGGGGKHTPASFPVARLAFPSKNAMGEGQAAEEVGVGQGPESSIQTRKRDCMVASISPLLVSRARIHKSNTYCGAT